MVFPWFSHGFPIKNVDFPSFLVCLPGRVGHQFTTIRKIRGMDPRCWPRALQLQRCAAWEGVAGDAPSRHAIIGALPSRIS